jgi:hypothetical protein
MANLDDMQRRRTEAALAANTEDAAAWRWFSSLMDERRIRWCLADEKWLVSVDNRHVATSRSFDSAIRMAKRNVEEGITFRQERIVASRKIGANHDSARSVDVRSR